MKHCQLFVTILVSVLLVEVASVVSTDTVISTDRNSYRVKLCASAALNFSSEEKSLAAGLISKYTPMIAQTNVIQKFIESDMKPSSVSLSDLSQIIIFVAPHVVCLLVVLLIWPCLCCCCVSPEKYPVFKGCRKPQKQLYTRIQLKWTSYVLMVVCMVCIGGGMAGLVKGNEIVTNYNNIGCRVTGVIDDIVAGRVSDDSSSFFVGLYPLSSQLEVFRSKLNTFYTQSANCLDTSGTLKTDGQSILTYSSEIYTNYSNRAYTNAFTQSDGTTYVSVASQFKDLYLGPSSDTTNTKMTGILYNKLGYYFGLINSALDPMLTSWTYLKTTKGQSTINATLYFGASALKDVSTSLNSTASSIGSIMYSPSSTQSMSIGLAALYGLMMTLAIVALVCAILIGFCSVVRLRLILYPVCVLLTICAVVSLIFLIIVAIALPVTVQTCIYLDTQLLTPNSTEALFNHLGMGAVGERISPCMNGDYNLIKKANTDLNDALDNIITISTNTQKFTTLINGYSNDNLATVITNARGVVTKVYNSSVLDLNDTVSSAFLTALSSKTYSKSGCSSSQVSADSWVASYTAGSCPVGMAVMPPCLNLGNTVTCPSGCYQIQNTFINSSGDSNYASTLQTRYTSGCPYVTYLTNLHQNYNQIRMADMTTVNGSLNTVKSSVDNYDNRINTLKTNLGSFSSNLNANFYQSTDLTNGALYGINCKPIQESVQAFRDGLCVGLINSLDYNLICLAILSWAAAFVMCCATCVGVKHYNHLFRVQAVITYSGVPISFSSDNKIIGEMAVDKD